MRTEDGVDGRKTKGEDSERGREYWLTCNTESGGGRDPANIKYIITFILISLLASVCLLARLGVAMASSAERARTNVRPIFLAHFLDRVNLDSRCRCSSVLGINR